jgi:predicted RNase H-like nuclease (RuvC/YqgF family)
VSDTDNEIEELNERILELERDIRELESEQDDLSDRLDEAHDEIRELEDASQSGTPIEITQHHIITLREAIENYGGTNSQRAMLADVMRLVEAC